MDKVQSGKIDGRLLSCLDCLLMLQVIMLWNRLEDVGWMIFGLFVLLDLGLLLVEILPTPDYSQDEPEYEEEVGQWKKRN